MKIWCVEDDSSIRDIEVYTLNSTGFAARGFADGAAFRAALETEEPDLVVLDVMLPGESGVELLQFLRGNPATAEIPIIMATAKGMVDSVVSTASVTSEAIAMYVRAMQNSFESENIKTLHSLVGGRVEALEFNVAPGLPFIGVPLKDLILRKGLLVAGIVRRNGQPVIPSGNDALQEGDDVVVVTTDTTLHSLRDIVVK